MESLQERSTDAPLTLCSLVHPLQMHHTWRTLNCKRNVLNKEANRWEAWQMAHIATTLHAKILCTFYLRTTFHCIHYALSNNRSLWAHFNEIAVEMNLAEEKLRVAHFHKSAKENAYQVVKLHIISAKQYIHFLPHMVSSCTSFCFRSVCADCWKSTVPDYWDL